MLVKSDQELWAKFREGDQAALEAIFSAHYDDLLLYGLKLTANEELVKDCLQDLFYKLWKNRRNLDRVQVIKPYLYKAFRYTIVNQLDSLNRRKKAFTQASIWENALVFSTEDFMIEEQQAQQHSKKLVAALNQLAPRQREAIYLRFFGEMDYEKVAEVMGIHSQSVRNLIHQACKHLKDHLVLLEMLFLILQASTLFTSR